MKTSRTLLRSEFLRLAPLALVSVALPSPADAAIAPQTARQQLEVTWEAVVPDTSKGYSLVLAPDMLKSPLEDDAEPNVPGAFAVGFDTYDPPSRNPFNADGNIYNQPQREISLHWNGREVANRLSPVEIKGTNPMRLKVEQASGGAYVTVTVDKTDVYEKYFVPELRLYASKPQTVGEATVTSLTARWRGKELPTALPLTQIRAFDRVPNDIDHHRNIAEVTFPDRTDGYGRVICVLTLAETPKGLDPWDRIAQIFLYDAAGERFEILRYITPYRKAWQWKADVTDFLPLLVGKKRMEVFCETYSQGWLVSVDFDFYPGKLDRRPYKVVNLWNATAVIGQADKPFIRAIPPKKVKIDDGAKKVVARFCVTGHGQGPNTDNAAEFIALWRKFTVNGTVYENTLWKTDNYLNPCRPQGGTWKFSRAGWAPGDVVAPWTVDITAAVHRGQEADVRYEIQPYENKTPENGNPARHLIESQVIFYR